MINIYGTFISWAYVLEYKIWERRDEAVEEYLVSTKDEQFGSISQFAMCSINCRKPASDIVNKLVAFLQAHTFQAQTQMLVE